MIGRLVAVMILGGMSLAHQAASAQPEQLTNPRPAMDAGNPSDTGNPSADLHALPPTPTGKSTILGGAIKDFDPVRDQFLLHIYGQRPMKILFDERTQVFLDGKKIPLRELGPEDHASVQTILDGSDVFALSIHILSQSPEGDTQGQVLSYNPRTGVLTVRSADSPEPIRLMVTENTRIVREGEPAFTSESSGTNDLMAGSLVTTSFRPAPGGRDVASRITVLAVPGSSFLFYGNISYLDMQAGALAIVDPRDGKSYQIHFDPALISGSQNLHVGESVTVQASYNGSQYVAAGITTH